MATASRVYKGFPETTSWGEMTVVVKPASPDWAAVVNMALDGSLGIIREVARLRTEGERMDTIGLVCLEQVSLLRLALEQKVGE